MAHITVPDDINATFAAAHNAGDVAALAQLYEPDAILIGVGNAERHGLDAIRAELGELIKLRGRMTSLNRYALVFEDIALLSADWRIETVKPDGSLLVIEGRSAEIARKQADGRWLYVVDHPWGASCPSRNNEERNAEGSYP
jgi:uncharacterized protein (TIGR02246 family)